LFAQAGQERTCARQFPKRGHTLNDKQQQFIRHVEQ